MPSHNLIADNSFITAFSQWLLQNITECIYNDALIFKTPDPEAADGRRKLGLMKRKGEYYSSYALTHAEADFLPLILEIITEKGRTLKHIVIIFLVRFYWISDSWWQNFFLTKSAFYTSALKAIFKFIILFVKSSPVIQTRVYPYNYASNMPLRLANQNCPFMVTR